MVNLQLDNDSRVAMQLMSSRTISSKELANQLAMFMLLNSATLINLETSTHIGMVEETPHSRHHHFGSTSSLEDVVP